MTEEAVAPATRGAAQIDADAYRAFVAGLELQRVDTMQLRAERLAHGDMADAETTVASSFAVDPAQGAVFYKFDLTSAIDGPDERRVGEVSASLVLVFRTAATDAPVEMVDHFGATAAYMMAHPYLRETVSALAARVGFPGLILPVVRP